MQNALHCCFMQEATIVSLFVSKRVAHVKVAVVNDVALESQGMGPPQQED